ncbi:MAG: T9SS type A sorting domain-containing protein [Bacteroidales bacterium]|nr:T9SS type A sorting domain-containing protein [Bacteroidales bacterium]
MIIFEKPNWITMFSFAYGSAFAPDTNAKAPYFRYPFSKDNHGNLILDSVIFSEYEKGFGDLRNKIITFKDSLLKLNGYGIDYGTNDFFRWIVEGSVYYHNLLTEENIPHQLWVNSGNHGDLHKSRTENYELPFCDSLLEFDTLNLDTEAGIEMISHNKLASDPVIDSENRIITVEFKSGTNLSNLKPNIFVSPGATFSPSQGATIDLTGGSVTYTVISEDGKNTQDWTIQIKTSGLKINQDSDESSIKVFPNPANDCFLVTSEKFEIEKIEVADILGQVIYCGEPKSLTWNSEVMDITPGTYLLKIQTKENYFLKKIICR